MFQRSMSRWEPKMKWWEESGGNAEIRWTTRFSILVVPERIRSFMLLSGFRISHGPLEGLNDHYSKACSTYSPLWGKAILENKGSLIWRIVFLNLLICLCCSTHYFYYCFTLPGEEWSFLYFFIKGIKKHGRCEDKTTNENFLENQKRSGCTSMVNF